MSRPPRLHLVREIRQRAEDDAKRALGLLERERGAIVAERGAIERGLVEASTASVPAAMREQLASFAAASRAAAADCDRRLAEQDGRIAGARDAVAEAHRGVRAIAALQDRDRAAALLGERRREGRANDEFAARRRLEAVS